MIGENIKKFRKENNLSQDELAEKLSVTRQCVSLWENGQTQPSLDNIITLAKLFGVTTDALLNSEMESSVIEEAVIENEKKTGVPKKKNGKKMAVSIVSVVLVLGLLASGVLLFGNKPFAEDTKAIADANLSVVKLVCFDVFDDEIASGSGFATFEEGLIVTNYHVIDGAYKVNLVMENGEEHNVKYIVADSQENDVAILKFEEPLNIPLLELAATDELQKGETVVTIGSPQGLQNSVSEGNYSGRHNDGSVEYLQFTAPISAGSSGGALFNNEGCVIGVTSASLIEGQNLNFAIPIEVVENVYAGKYEEKTITGFARLHNDLVDTYLDFRSEGKTIQKCSFSDIMNNPSKYKTSYVYGTAYFSSFDGNSIYLCTDPSYVTGDSKIDKQNALVNFHTKTGDGKVFQLRVKKKNISAEVGSTVNYITRYHYLTDSDYILFLGAEIKCAG